MAGVQATSTVHRQATFETNRLKLQRQSLDLPVIDSGEGDDKYTPVPKPKQAVSYKDVNKDTNINSASTTTKKGQQSPRGDTNANTQYGKVQTTQNSSQSKSDKEDRKESHVATDSKPKVQSTKTLKQNKPPSPEHNKGTAQKDAIDSKSNNQSERKKDQAKRNVSPERRVPKLDEANKSDKANDTKKTVKKESVLSKLNANKTTKLEAVSKQGDKNTNSPPPAKNSKSQNAHSESDQSKTNKVNVIIHSKVSKPNSEATKTSPKKVAITSDNVTKTPRGNSDKAQKGIQNSKTANEPERKPDEKKSENLQTNKLRNENKLKEEDKQIKTSVSKGLNPKRQKSPERKPVSNQTLKQNDPPSPKGKSQGLDSKLTNKDNPETITHKPKADQPISSDKNKSVTENKQKHKPQNHSDQNTASKGEARTKEVKTNSPVLAKSPNKSQHPDPPPPAKSPRSKKSNSPVQAETKVSREAVSPRKTPVVTTLNSQSDDQDISNDTNPNDSKDDNLVRMERNSPSERHSDTGQQNPLVERLNIEQRERKMEIRRPESYESVSAERNTLLKAEVAYKKRIKQLEDEANGFLKVIEDLTAESRSLRKKVDMLEEEMHSDGKTNFVERIEDMEEQNRMLKTLMKEQKEVIAQLKDKNGENGGDDNQNEVRNLKQQIVQLQTDNQKQNEENVKLKAEYYESVKKLNAMDVDKSDGASKGTALDAKSRKTIQSLQNENADLKKKVNSLEFENDTLSQSLDQKKSELTEILGVMKDENKFDNELKDLKNEVLKLKKERRELELDHVKEKRELQDELQETKSQLSHSKAECDELKIKADEAETETNKVKEQVSRLNQEDDSHKKEIEALKAEVKRLEKELQESKDMYSRLLSETESANKDLKATKTEMEQFNRDLQKIVAEKESQISKLISQLDSLRQEREVERKQMAEEKDELTGEKEDLTKETQRLKVFEANYLKKEKELQICKEKLDDSDHKRKQLTITVEDKGFEISNLQQQVFELNMKMDNYSKRMSQLDKDKRGMESDKRDWEIKRDKVGDIESSNKRLLEENRRLRNQLEVSTSIATDHRTPPSPIEKEKGPTEAWVNDKSNQQTVPVNKERTRKKVHILLEHSVPKKRQPYTKSSPVRSKKQQPKETLKVAHGLNSSRSLEDIRRSPPDRRGSPESQPSLPEVSREPHLTFGGTGHGGYTQIHRNKVLAAAKKRVY